MATKYTAWVDDVVGEVGCPKTLATARIKAAVREFCKESGAWAHDPPPITTQEGIDEYLIPRLSNAAINQVLFLEDADSGIEYDPIAQPADYHNGYKFHHGTPEKIRIWPKPAAGHTLKIKVSLIPKATATEVGDIIADVWYDAILEGALYRIKSLPGREWTDVTMAKTVHERNFRRYIGDAISARVAGYSDAPMFVKHVPFGG